MFARYPSFSPGSGGLLCAGNAVPVIGMHLGLRRAIETGCASLIPTAIAIEFAVRALQTLSGTGKPQHRVATGLRNQQIILIGTVKHCGLASDIDGIDFQ